MAIIAAAAAGFLCGLAVGGRSAAGPTAVAGQRQEDARPPAAPPSAAERREDPAGDAAGAQDVAWESMRLAFQQGQYEAQNQLGTALWRSVTDLAGCHRLLKRLDAEPNHHLAMFLLGALAVSASAADPAIEAHFGKQLWSRMTSHRDPSARDSFFSYFCDSPGQRNARVDDLRALAVSDPLPAIRQRAISALGACLARPGVAETLCTVATLESGKLRATAIWAMQGLDDPRARRIVAAAVHDPDPEIRAAAFHASPTPEDERDREEFVHRLHDELGTSSQPRNKAVVIDRLLDLDPRGLATRLRNILPRIQDEATRRYFVALLAAMDSGIADGAEIRASTWRLRAAYAYR